MKLHEPGDFPVIEGTAAEVAQIASAALAAVKHHEAVVMSRGVPIIGFQVVGSSSSPVTRRGNA